MIWKFIQDKLEKSIRTVLLTVVETKGSSPGRAGFKMAFSEDEDWEGSVGGGKMEYDLLDLAREMLVSGQKIKLKRLVHGGDEAGPDSSGLICAGSQQVVLVVLDIGDLPLIREIITHEKGVFTISSQGIRFLPAKEKLLSVKLQFEAGDNWRYTENLGVQSRLYIFGGGHVGLAVSRLFSLLDFYITVLDNRGKELKTLKENEFVHEIRIIDYGKAGEEIPEGNNIYVVIMTSSHASDGQILGQLLSKKIKYLGMMGSEKKVKFIFRSLLDLGYSQQLLDKVDAPIGLDIDSETPMEIAVSIAARIIQVKNKT